MEPPPQPAVSRRLAEKAAKLLNAGKAPPRVKITLPEELKYVLVSDFELVKTRKHLFNLPAKVSITQILSDYSKHVEKLGHNDKVPLSELILGIKDLFNDNIGRQLLYLIEKPQYESITSGAVGDKTAADLYGSAHLLRLMARFNSILTKIKIDEKDDIEFIETGLQDFLAYLETNRAKYFTSKNYVEATEEYLKKANAV